MEYPSTSSSPSVFLYFFTEVVSNTQSLNILIFRLFFFDIFTLRYFYPSIFYPSTFLYIDIFILRHFIFDIFRSIFFTFDIFIFDLSWENLCKPLVYGFSYIVFLGSKHCKPYLILWVESEINIGDWLFYGLSNF